MRLINTRTLELENHDDVSVLPAYAILSHRWIDTAEVTYQDMLQPHRQWMPGWTKIAFCCRQAVKDNLDYAWVDTCCIDKTSSSELSEAINSMFQWYAEAQVCYAFLNDINIETPQLKDRSEGDQKNPANQIAQSIVHSAWFSRAWTLQELIAPRSVRFYDTNYQYLVTKHDISEQIEAVHRIPAAVTRDPARLYDYSTAARMSWAAHRKATRLEDRAYSLFGIFDVKLPLLYGEGMQAFVRLQEEIIRQSHDHSLFAWQSLHDGPQNALASSPEQFLSCNDIESLPVSEDDEPYSMTNIGLSIELQLFPYTLEVFLGLVKCQYSTSTRPGLKGTRLGILLSRSTRNNSLWYRVATNGSNTVSLPADMTVQLQQSSSRRQKIYIVKDPTKGQILSAEEKSNASRRPFYGLKLNAPQFIEYSADFGRAYSLLAYHDWQETRSSRTRLSNAINHFRKNDSVLGATWKPDDQTRPLGRKRRQAPELSSQELSFASLTAEIKDTLHYMNNNHTPHIELPSAPVGILRLPPLSTGKVGIVFFDKVIHGIVAMKLGFTFDFQPVLLLATHEVLDGPTNSCFPSSTHSRRPRFWKFEQLETDPWEFDYSQGRATEIWGSRDIWGGTGTGAVLQEEDMGEDGSVLLVPGIYAFKPKLRADADHWIFKPHPDEPWHLLIEIQKQRVDDIVFWEVSLRMQQEILAIHIEDCDEQRNDGSKDVDKYASQKQDLKRK